MNEPSSNTMNPPYRLFGGESIDRSSETAHGGHHGDVASLEARHSISVVLFIHVEFLP